MQQVCIFVHMPKAGGSTLQEIIQRQYALTETLNIVGESVASVQRSVDQLRLKPEQERGRIACVKGHVPFGIHQWLPRTPRYITMLRDPVQRLVSDYFFTLNTPRHINFEQMQHDRLSLEEFVALRHEQGLCDIYCRLLGDVSSWDRLADSPPALPPGALDTAKSNMERYFAVVGVTERFDESLLLMQKELGWRDVYYERANVTPDKPAQVDLTEKALEVICQHNGQDIILYEYAMRRMDALIAEQGEKFAARVRRFGRKNDLYHRWHQLKRTVASRFPSLVAHH